MNSNLKLRIAYAASAAVLLLIEVFIALFVRDRFVRPYVGDMLVPVLLCCIARIFLPNRFRLLPFAVFIFCTLVETAQFFDYAALLGLAGNLFFSTLLGSTFSWADILCYGIGAVLFIMIEHSAKNLFNKKSKGD